MPERHGRRRVINVELPSSRRGMVVPVGLISKLRRKLFGPTLRWECVDCATVHKSNPKRCKSCGSTILRQKRDS